MFLGVSFCGLTLILRLLRALITWSSRVSADGESLREADPEFGTFVGRFQMSHTQFPTEVCFCPIPVHVQLTLMKKCPQSESVIDSSASRAFPDHEWLFLGTIPQWNSLCDEHSPDPKVAMYDNKDCSLQAIFLGSQSQLSAPMVGFNMSVSNATPHS